MPVGSLPEDDAVSLLRHEETERQAEVGFQQCLAKTVGRLLGVPDLTEVCSLYNVSTRWQSLLTHSISKVSFSSFNVKQITRKKLGCLGLF